MGRPTIAVRWTAFGVSAVYTAVLWLVGLEVDSLTQFLALLPSLSAAVLIAWDLFLWKLKPFSGFTRRPRLEGLWQVTLTPTSESHIPEGGNTGPIDAYLVVVHTYWSFYGRLLTSESASWSRAHFWGAQDGAPTEHLTFTYQNEPRADLEHRSRSHLGSCTLRPETKSPETVTGVYSTDRYTRGDMKLRLVDRSSGYATYDKAKAHQSKKE